MWELHGTVGSLKSGGRRSLSMAETGRAARSALVESDVPGDHVILSLRKEIIQEGKSCINDLICSV